MQDDHWDAGLPSTPLVRPATVRPESRTGTVKVRLPHTVQILPYNYCNENDYQCLCGYRREFFAPRKWAGRTVLLTFGAVAHNATVSATGGGYSTPPAATPPSR